MKQRECAVLLHNLRSVYNVGSIFRTCDGAGVSKIILSGYTPGPVDHNGKERKDFAKVALGSGESVPWERTDAALRDTVERLKREGYQILALECDARAENIFTFAPRDKIVLILGSEVVGVDPEILASADAILSIPMNGAKTSLNVSVASGVALYQLLR